MINLFGLHIFTKRELLKISDDITISVDNAFKSYGHCLKLKDFNHLKKSLKKAFKINDTEMENKKL